MAILFETISFDLIAILLIFLSITYYYVHQSYAYWKKRDIKYMPPTFPFGSFLPLIRRKISFGLLASDIYKKSTEPFVGYFTGLKPGLVLRDPAIIRAVLTKDFQHFHDRGLFYDEVSNPLTGHLFAMSGEKWRNLRAKLTPTFTSGKLKAMFSTLLECGVPLHRKMSQIADTDGSIELRELMAQYTTNIIASVAFGIDVNCIDEPETPFRKFGRKSVMPPAIGILTATVFPKIAKLFGLKIVHRDVEEFILSVVTQNMEYREKNNVTRKDFFQLLLQIRNTGTVQMDEDWTTKISADKKLSINECAAQSFVFFVAGFETSSSTMSFCLYELAKDAECHRKVQLEIDETLSKNNGILTFEAVQDMKYLESCIDETLRLHPSLPVLHRECSKDWNIPGTDVTVEKGTGIMIPIYGIQRDQQYYAQPEKFIPDRFSAENLVGTTFVDRPYIPFGDGPRICIGMRLGKMQVKVGLILLLSKYNFELTGNTLEPLRMEKKGLLLAPVGGIVLKVKHRKIV